MKLLRFLLFPFAVLYRVITGLRNVAFNRGWLKSTAFEVPVICVGNLSVGGTGKSPHIEYLARLLKGEHRVATLSRGYGRSTSGFLLVREDSEAQAVGDEPLQFKAKFPELTVAVDEQRVRGIHTLLQSEQPPSVVLLDDAFQHRKAKAGFNVLLTTFQAPYYRDYLLPTGNLREGRSGARRAHCIVVTKCPPSLTEAEQKRIRAAIAPHTGQEVYFSSYAYANPVGINSSSPRMDLEGLKAGNYSVVLLTGIAQAGPLVETLKQYSAHFEHLKYPDHHAYTVADLQKLRKIFDNIAGHQKVVITTEKDAMRLREPSLASSLSDLPVYALPIAVEFHSNGQQAFNAQILAYAARTNEGNR